MRIDVAFSSLHERALRAVQVEYNPQDWAAQMGQNYSANARTSGIDVAGLHVWCDTAFYPTSSLSAPVMSQPCVETARARV